MSRAISVMNEYGFWETLWKAAEQDRMIMTRVLIAVRKHNFLQRFRPSYHQLP
jgi:hypothetical protein